jgi:hypothetical protein
VNSRNFPYRGRRIRAVGSAIVAAPLLISLASSQDYAHAASISYETQAGTYHKIDLLSYPQFQSLSNPSFLVAVDRPEIAEVAGLSGGRLEIYGVRSGRAMLSVQAIGEAVPPLILPLEIGVHTDVIAPSVSLQSNVAYHGITPYASMAAAQSGLFYLIPADSEFEAAVTKQDLEKIVKQRSGLKMAVIHSSQPHMIDTSELATNLYKVMHVGGSGQVSTVSSEVLLFNAADMRELLKPEGGVITIEEIAKYLLAHRDEVEALDLNKDGQINGTDVGILMKMLDGVYIGLEANADPRLTHAFGGLRAYVGNELSVSLEGRFTDADSDKLTYSVETADSGIAEASVNGGLLSIHARSVGSTTVQVTARDARGGVATMSFSLSVIANAAPTATDVKITGTTAVGDTLTGKYSYTDADGDAEGATQLRWFSGTTADGTGKTAIADATTNQLVITPDLQGKYIFFEVTPRAAAGAEGGATVLSSPVSIAANAAPVAINLSMAGASGLGETLIAMYEYSDAEDDQEGASTYVWYVGADPNGSDRTIIPGENTRYLTVTHELQGKYLFFEVTPRAVSGTAAGIPVLSYPTEIAANAAPTASGVMITGQPGYGNSLYGNYLFEDSDGESEAVSSFQWYIGVQADGSDKTPIAGATSRELWITSYEQGKYVFFEVTPRSLSGITEGSPAVSSPVAVPANEAPSVHSIFLSGTPKTGETLAVNFTYADAENDYPEAIPSVQWYMAADSDLMTSEAISGETGTSIMVTSDMENKWVYAVVTPRALTGSVEGEPARSNALKIPVNQAPSAYNVSIAGTPYVGEQLNASYTYSDSEYDSEGPPSYQWYIADDASGTNKAPIAGATNGSYTITPQEAGRFVAVSVTPTALTGTSAGEPAESSWTEIAPELPVIDSFTFGDSDSEAGYLAGSFNWSVAGDSTGLQGFNMYWMDSEGSQLGHVISPTASTDRTAAILRTSTPYGAVEIVIRPYRYVGTPSVMIEGAGLAISLASIDNDDATEALAIIDAALVANDINDLTPTHFANVGLTGVTEDNVSPFLSRLTQVRASWGVPLTASDMQAQLSVLINSRDNLLQTIRNYYWIADEGSYQYAGVTGVNANNLGAVSKMLYKFNQENPAPYIPTWAELQDVVSATVPEEANTVITAAQGLAGSKRVTLTIDLRNSDGTGIEGYAQGSFSVTIPEIMPSPIALTNTTYFDTAYTGTGGIYTYVFKGPADGTNYTLTNLLVNGAVIEASLPVTTPEMDLVAPDDSRGSVQPQNGATAGEITLSLISSKPGKIYYILQDAALAAPTAVQVMAGKDAAEAMPYASGSIDYAEYAVGSYNTVFLTNVTTGVTLKLYVVLSNLSGVNSVVYTSPYPVTITALSSLGVLNKFAAENNSFYGTLSDMQAIAPFVTESTLAEAKAAFKAARDAKGADLTEAEALSAISESLINDAALSNDWSSVSLSVFSAAGMTNVTVDNLEAVKVQIANERISLGADLSGIKLISINSLFG